MQFWRIGFTLLQSNIKGVMYRRTARFNRNRQCTNARPPYIIFNPHSTGNSIPFDFVEEGTEKVGPRYFHQVAAIDPGTKNCAIRVERRSYALTDESTISSEKFTTGFRPFLPQSVVGFDDPESEFRNKWKLESVETIAQEKYDFTDSPSPESEEAAISEWGNASASGAHYIYAKQRIEALEEHFINCQYIVVESQMPVNTEMVRMAQHIMSTLFMTVRDKGAHPLIIEIDAKLKTSVLCAPPGMKKYARKKWAGLKAVEVLESNRDFETAELIKRSTKKDDHGDVVCYTETWFRILKDGIHKPMKAPISRPKAIPKEKVVKVPKEKVVKVPKEKVVKVPKEKVVKVPKEKVVKVPKEKVVKALPESVTVENETEKEELLPPPTISPKM